MEVCPLSREIMLSVRSDAISILSITDRRSLFPSSCARLPIGLPCGLLSQREDDGVATFHVSTQGGLGLTFPPVVRHLRQEIDKLLHLTTCLLAQASQHLWLVTTHDVYR